MTLVHIKHFVAPDFHCRYFLLVVLNFLAGIINARKM